MAYDVDLADRLRALLSGEPDVVEKRMFGGLAFLVAGHLAVSVSGQGGLLLRVDPTQSEALLADPRIRPFEMRGRELAGWLHLDVDDAVSEDELRSWVDLGVVMARSLPPR
jgi:hypothetical protein